MCKKTLWLAVTGLDGSGKTTLVQRLAEYYRSKYGLRVKTDRFPHDHYLDHVLLNKSKDSYTDRLLFALDNRLLGTEIAEDIQNHNYDLLITQRCFLDSFVHGAVQGFSYDFIEELNRLSDLPRSDVLVHLVAEASVAYARICNDPDADKFEYPAYIRKQEIETRRAYAEIIGNNPALASFKDAHHIYVDTTQMSPEDVFSFVRSKLEALNLFNG